MKKEVRKNVGRKFCKLIRAALQPTKQKKYMPPVNVSLNYLWFKNELSRTAFNHKILCKNASDFCSRHWGLATKTR